MNLYFPVFFNRVSWIGSFTAGFFCNILFGSCLTFFSNCGVAMVSCRWQKGGAIENSWALKYLESQACE